LVQITHYTSPNYTDHPKGIYTVYWTFFHRSEFLSNLRLPCETECTLNSLYCIHIFYHSGFLSNLCLPWKTELAWNFSLYSNIFYHSRFLSYFALALKNRVCPKIFHCIEIFLPFRIFEQLTLTRGCPDNFQAGSWKGTGGCRPSPRTPMVVRSLWNKNAKSLIKICQISSKHDKQAKTGRWMSILNYPDEQWKKFKVLLNQA